LLGEILEGHEAVVRFFGEPEHGMKGESAAQTVRSADFRPL